MKRFYILLIFNLLTTITSYAQSGIFGVVKDEDTGEVLVGAAIYNDSLQVGTITDFNGYYNLSLQPGMYNIRYSYLGYTTVEKFVVVDNSRKRLNVNMKMEAQMLDKVVITSERKDANVRELAMSVQKLEMVKIRKIPALMGEVDVIKAVQLLPGVQAASEGSSGFSVRGGSPDQNLITLDDAPVYNASHFLGFFSVFNNDVVKDATLYKGDIPANYESRLSSVLDIKTLDEVPDRFTMTGGVGILTSRLMLNMPFNHQRTGVMLAGRVTYGGLLTPYIIDKLKDTRLYFYDLNAKVTHVFNANNRLFVSAYNGYDKIGIVHMMGIGYGNTTATARWNHIFTDKLTSNLSMLYTDYKYDIDVTMNPYDFSLKAGIKDLTARYDFTWLLSDKITSKFGVSGTFHRYNQGELNDRTGVVAEFLTIDPKEKVYRKAIESALYYSHDHDITPLFSVRYGLRLSMYQNIGAETLYLFDDNYNFYDSIIYGKGEIFHTEVNLEPRLAMVYRLGATSSVKASYSRTVQYAQLASNSTGGLPFDVWFPTNPNIRPQKCDQFAVGYFRNFRGNDIETSCELFYKNLIDVIDFVDDAEFYGNLLIDGEVRIGKGRSYGAEFLIRKNYGKLTGWIAYTYSRSFRTVKGISHDQEYRSPYDRPHNISIVINYEFTDRFNASANWVYNTGQPITYPYGKFTDHGSTYAIYNGYRNQSRYPDYHRLDLSVTWKGKKHARWQGEWNVSIYNVYGRHNTWAVMFTPGEDNTLETKKMYLFSVVPSISYNFKY
ncbi:MAG: TonB-dependent receptor [Bacteroidales bacterium]|nr:TonB-dependent receptor [Bacteroidales bacterium]